MADVTCVAGTDTLTVPLTRTAVLAVTDADQAVAGVCDARCRMYLYRLGVAFWTCSCVLGWNVVPYVNVMSPVPLVTYVTAGEFAATYEPAGDNCLSGELAA